MKKIVLVLAVIFAVGFTFTSCKKDKKADTTEEVAKETASNDEVYQCPMDCEHGKSYTEAGKCPVCEMALKTKKVGEEVSEHKHDDACTCKDGGECKCAEGECKCGDAKECTKCPEGKCTCDKDAKAECTKCGHSKAECTCPKDKA
ncbi:MAG TPA: hypothetical protein DDZ39_06900 [Flavobacteriaceae bacterium]|jgi:hypothetical protein|nr:hypothetical protein [Flavobacteriaceae bacterium]HBS12504.1 hypothetical protein [Flavobacteriaceae bacterium]